MDTRLQFQAAQGAVSACDGVLSNRRRGYISCALPTSNSETPADARTRRRRPAVSTRPIRSLRFHRTHLRVDLVAVPQALSRTRRLRTDGSVVDIHGWYGAWILAGWALHRPPPAAAVGLPAGRGADRDSGYPVSSGIRHRYRPVVCEGHTGPPPG